MDNLVWWLNSGRFCWSHPRIPRNSDRFCCSHLHIPRDSIATTGSVAFMQYSQRQRSNDRFYCSHPHIPRDNDSFYCSHPHIPRDNGRFYCSHPHIPRDSPATVGSIALIHIFPETVYTYPRAGHDLGPWSGLQRSFLGINTPLGLEMTVLIISVYGSQSKVVSVIIPQIV